MQARVLVRQDGLWQLTPRGIYEIDPKTGAVRRIFRGKDLGVVGGDLFLTDDWLIAVSNRTISAYPRRAAGSRVAARNDLATTEGEASKMNRSKIAGIMLLFAFCHPARAQFFDGEMMAPGAPQNIEGFTVAGKGQVAAKPDKFEIDLEVSAASELTADAVVKYRDAKRRIHEAFTALKLGNVAVEERGLLVDQKGMMQSPYFFGYEQNTRTKTEVQLTRKTGRQGRRHSQDGRGSRAATGGQAAGRRPGRRRKVGGQDAQSLLLLQVQSSPHDGAGSLRARRFRQASGSSVREGDRRCASPRRTACAIEPRRAGTDRGGPRARRPRREQT